MINQLKTDRVSQIMLVAVVIAGLFACAVIAVLLFFVVNNQDVAPAIVGPTPTVTLLQFDGNGDDIVFFDIPRDGMTLIGLVHHGEHNFIVHLLKHNNSSRNHLVNEIGRYEGQKAEWLDADRYMLEITADGSWTVIVLPPQ